MLSGKMVYTDQFISHSTRPLLAGSSIRFFQLRAVDTSIENSTHLTGAPDIPVEFITEYDHGSCICHQSFENGIIAMPPAVMVNDGRFWRFYQQVPAKSVILYAACFMAVRRIGKFQ